MCGLQQNWNRVLSAQKNKMADKILIGVTLHDSKKYIIERFMKNLLELDLELNTDFIFVDNSKEKDFADFLSKKYFQKIIRNPVWLKTSRERQCYSLNLIREEFLKGDYTHLFLLECDLIPPIHIIKTLLDHDKDSCAAVYLLYPKEKGITCLTINEYIANNNIFANVFVNKGFIDGDLKEVINGCGIGCVLIKRKMLEKVKFRSTSYHADTYFWPDARSYGFKPFVDTSQIIRHYPRPFGKDF